MENCKKVFLVWLTLVEAAISKISKSKGFQWERIMLYFHISMYFIHKIKCSLITLSWNVIFQSRCNASVWNGLYVFGLMFLHSRDGNDGLLPTLKIMSFGILRTLFLQPWGHCSFFSGWIKYKAEAGSYKLHWFTKLCWFSSLT